MNSFSENPGKRPKEERAPKESFTLRDKLLFFAPILGFFFLMIAVVMKTDDKEHEQSIRKRVEKWKTEFALTEPVANEILEKEMIFHSTHSWFSLKRPPSPEETAAHDLAIRELLGTDESNH
ncbi:MAG: hypothetical protein ABJQ29_01565 [Luteolibacter sp.]